MLRYLLAVTDCLFLPALVAGFYAAALAAYPGTRRQTTWFARALLAGISIAIILVVLKRNTGMVVREYYNLALLIPLLGLGLAVFFVLLAGQGRRLWWLASPGVLFLAAFHLPDIFIYPLDFGLGMESVFNRVYLGKVAGYSLGLVLVALTGLGVTLITRTLPGRLSRFFFSSALVVYFFRNLLGLTQILLGRGLVKREPLLVRPTIYLLDHVDYFNFALLALVGGLLLVWLLTPRPRRVPANPAIGRRWRAQIRRERRWVFTTLVGVVALLAIHTLGREWAERSVEIPPPTRMEATDGVIGLVSNTVD
ncbi:MAG: hypothetical protein LBU79_10245, partial [Planctomycetota bacterium]|nr:hypothetical protein [Planctomycetota bacterium]